MQFTIDAVKKHTHTPNTWTRINNHGVKQFPQFRAAAAEKSLLFSSSFFLFFSVAPKISRGYILDEAATCVFFQRRWPIELFFTRLRKSRTLNLVGSSYKNSVHFFLKTLGCFRKLTTRRRSFIRVLKKVTFFLEIHNSLGDTAVGRSSSYNLNFYYLFELYQVCRDNDCW